MFGVVWWDFFTCCTTRDREGDHLLPAVPPARTMRSDSGRGNLDVPSAPAGAHSVSSFWGSLWGAGESKAEQKDELDNHVGLKELSSTHSQIYMLKEQLRLLQRQNEQLMNHTLPTVQPTHDVLDEDLALLKSQLAELKSRNAHLEDELSSQGVSSQGSSLTRINRRPRRRGVKESLTPPRRGSSAPNVNVAAAAAQVARNGLLKKGEGIEDGRTQVDLTSMRPAHARPPTRVRKSTVESDVCDLTGLRERQSVLLVGSSSRQ